MAAALEIINTQGFDLVITSKASGATWAAPDGENQRVKTSRSKPRMAWSQVVFHGIEKNKDADYPDVQVKRNRHYPLIFSAVQRRNSKAQRL